jgi:hypothetical protein
MHDPATGQNEAQGKPGRSKQRPYGVHRLTIIVSRSEANLHFIKRLYDSCCGNVRLRDIPFWVAGG